MGANTDSISFKLFLEDTPLYIRKNVTGFFNRRSDITPPELKLECHGKDCRAIQFFESDDKTHHPIEGYGDLVILDYLCRNCQSIHKYFCIQFVIENGEEAKKFGQARVIKLGEYPQYQFASVQALRKSDPHVRILFQKGLTAENSGLGIGAFSYYRRVVENNKDSLINAIITIARNQGASSDDIQIFERAKTEQQFTKSIESIKDLIPKSLFIENHNLLKILHSILSEGIHNKSDEDCLLLAKEIRVLFVRLNQRIEEYVRDESEVRAALNIVQNLNKKDGKQNKQ